jgi:conserved oligomeric Golgi complex subunit 3
MHLLHTWFKSVSLQLFPLLAKPECQADAHPQELLVLLVECHVAYFSACKSLLVNQLMVDLKGLDPTRTELVELVCQPPFNDYPYFFDSLADKSQM